MSDLRRPSLRLAAGLAVFVVGLLEVQALVHTVSGQVRQRERVVRGVRTAIEVSRPRLAALLGPGGAAAWTAAIRESLALSLGSEVEVFDPSGNRLERRPSAPCPVTHWPGPQELSAARDGAVVSVGPVLGEKSRLLSYAEFASGSEAVILRFASAVPDLVLDLQERRRLLIGHAVSLAVIALAAALAVFPGGEAAPPGGPRALGAYETAMEKLRDRRKQEKGRYEVERRRLEEALRDTQALARAGELTAGMVHEVRNGLGTILGYARLIEARPESAAAESAASIRQECETLEGVVRRFMDFVRQESLRVAPFDLGRLLSRVVARESRARGVADLRLDCAEGLLLGGDEELLERAFENLVRNALEAAGPAGSVSVRVAREDGDVRVAISDDGPGLPAEAPREGRPFFTTKAGGLGLGLPMAFKIVRLHAGALAFGPARPRGLEVVVTLPADGPPGPEALP